MKAITYTRYGPPEVLRLEELEKPTPGAGQVLIQVRAAAANPADWHTMRGAPFLARLVNGLFKPTNPRLGLDLAGRVEALGSGVTHLHAGDEVFGSLPLSAMGSFAEYVCVDEKFVALKPAGLSFEQAATVPLAAFTALQGLRDKGRIRAGQTVLVNGASGGVGTFAVQIARSYGTEVTGVCSTGNLELVRSLGAEHVIDYTREDFTQGSRRYDLIFDAVGNHSVADCRRALNPGGICAVAGFTSLALLFQVMLLGGKDVGLMQTARTDQQDLLILKELLEAGKIVPVIDRSYPLAETAAAIGYLEAGHARGKVVIRVGQDQAPGKA